MIFFSRDLMGHEHDDCSLGFVNELYEALRDATRARALLAKGLALL